MGSSRQGVRGSCRRLARRPRALRTLHWAGLQKAKRRRGIGRDPGLEPRSGTPVTGGANDCEPPQFRRRATLQTRHAAAPRRSMEMEPTWSPTRCHCGPDGRGAAVLGTCDGHELARSGRQTSTALEPARPQNIASGACGHAGTEAMLLRPAAVIGLERTLHEGPPRSTEPRRGPQIVAS
jgi:hypothetical protein